MSVEDIMKAGHLGGLYLENVGQIRRLYKEIAKFEAENKRLEAEVKEILKSKNLNYIFDDKRGISVDLIVSEDKRFDTGKLKANHPQEYELCRKPSKRFSRKSLKEKFPDLYDNYTYIHREENIVIETREELPSI